MSTPSLLVDVQESDPIDQSIPVAEDNNIVTMITNKVVNLIITEINNPSMRTMIRQKVITPVINMMYGELYPYIIALIITICCILLFSLLTFLCFLLFYFKK